MAVDKNYGSGKPRSAANSRSRQRVAAGNFTKGGRKLQTRKMVARIAKKNPPTNFIGGGLNPNRLFTVADALKRAGNIEASKAVISRAEAIIGGRMGATTLGGAYTPAGQLAREASRRASTSVYPRLDPFSGNRLSAVFGEVKQNLRQMQIKDMQRNTKFIKKPK